MSLFQQADEARFVRSKPMQTMVLTEAKAALDDDHRGSDVDRTVRISGMDSYGNPQSASIPFRQSSRGDAAVLADEIAATGVVSLKGEVQLGAKGFRATSAQSGDAVLDQRHDRFDMKRLVSYGLAALKGRSENEVEAAAVAAHRAHSANGR
jgi:hypothetical protein